MEPPWKKLKLSLERPYRDDDGNRIPVLLDITTDGQHIYEPQEDFALDLGEKLRRIFIERGLDFFDKNTGSVSFLDDAKVSHGGMDHETESTIESQAAEKQVKIMTTEELFKMHMDILPQLFISLGEMSHARDLLTSLLSSPESQASTGPPAMLSATVVTKPPAIVSVRAFNAQLAIGGKDEALRRAADVFKVATESMERARVKGEKYWVDALKIRRGNWGLIPAPLPFGSAIGKGADKTSKDFLVSFGLEESPSQFRRRAVGHMAGYDTTSDGLVFPHRQHTRLRVALNTVTPEGVLVHSQNVMQLDGDGTLDKDLKAAQQEVVEQEIFSLLVQDAGNLPTASARVSERLIVIDAAQGMELIVELVDVDSVEKRSTSSIYDETCNLIYFVLQALLLRRHGYLKLQRQGTAGIVRLPGAPDASQAPRILQPIIDLLQYQVFCERIKTELDRMRHALEVVGIPSTLRFDAVGEVGQELIQLLDEYSGKTIGGEAILRIDGRHTVRLTLMSPSSLTAHLSQATLPISSIPQLRQLLTDESERCILQRIREIGSATCDSVGGTWFVDLNRCVGRWDGCVLNFRVVYGDDFAVDCTAYRLDRTTAKQGELSAYSTHNPSSLPLFSWVEDTIKGVISHPQT